MSDIYLRKEQGDYYLYLLGKNGEPKKNVNVNIKLIHLQLGSHSDTNTNITTNKNGKIKLGHLNKIAALEINVPLFSI